jgi:hypothetical protein
MNENRNEERRMEERNTDRQKYVYKFRK